MTQEEAFQAAVAAMFSGPLQGTTAPSDPYAYTPGMVTTAQQPGLLGTIAGLGMNMLGLTAPGLNGDPSVPIFKTSFNWHQQDITSNQAQHIINNNRIKYALNKEYTDMIGQNLGSYFSEGSFFGGLLGSMAGDPREGRSYQRTAKSLISNPMVAGQLMPLLDRAFGYDRGAGMNVIMGRSNYMLSGLVGDLGIDGRNGFIDANSKELGDLRKNLATEVYRGLYQNMYDENGLKNYNFNFGLDEKFMSQVLSEATAAGVFDELKDENGNVLTTPDGTPISLRGGKGKIDWHTYRESMVNPLLESVKEDKLAIEGDKNLTRYDNGLKSEKETLEGLEEKKKENDKKLESATTDREREIYSEASKKYAFDIERSKERIKSLEESTKDRDKVRKARGDDINRVLKEISDATGSDADSPEAKDLKSQIDDLEKQKQEKKKKADTSVEDAKLKDIRKKVSEATGGEIDTSETRTINTVINDIQNKITTLRNEGKNDEADKLDSYLTELKSTEGERKKKKSSGDTSEEDNKLKDLRKKLSDLTGGGIDTSETRSLHEISDDVQKRITALRNEGKNDEADNLVSYLDELQAKIDEKQKKIDEVNAKIKEIDKPIRDAFEKVGSDIAASVDALKDIFGSTEEAYRQLKKMTGGNQFSEGMARTVEMEIRELTNTAALAGIDPKMMKRMLEANQTIFSAQRGMSQADIAAGYGDNAATEQQAIVQTLGLAQAMIGKDAKTRQELEVQSRFGADQKANSTMQRAMTQLEHARQTGKITNDEYEELRKGFSSGNTKTWNLTYEKFANKVYGGKDAAYSQLNDLAQIKYLEEELDVQSGLNRTYNMNRAHRNQYADQLALSEAMEDRKVAVSQLVQSGVTFAQRREQGTKGQFEGITRSLENSQKGDPAKNKQVANILKQVKERALRNGKSEAEANEEALRAFQQYKGVLGEAGDEAETAGIKGETSAYNEMMNKKTDIKISQDRSALSGMLGGIKALKDKDNLTVGDIGKIGNFLFSDEANNAVGLRAALGKDYDKLRSQYSEAMRKGDMGTAYSIMRDLTSRLGEDAIGGLGLLIDKGQFDQRENKYGKLSAKSAAAKFLTGQADVTSLKYFENLHLFNKEEDIFKLAGKSDEATDQLLKDMRSGRIKALENEKRGDAEKLAKAMSSNKAEDWIALFKNPNVSDEEFKKVSLKQFQDKVGETMMTFFENLDEEGLKTYAKILGVDEKDATNKDAIVEAYKNAATAQALTVEGGPIDPNKKDDDESASGGGGSSGSGDSGTASGDKNVVAEFSESTEGVIKELIQAVKDLVLKLEGNGGGEGKVLAPEGTSSPGGG